MLSKKGVIGILNRSLIIQLKEVVKTRENRRKPKQSSERNLKNQ